MFGLKDAIKQGKEWEKKKRTFKATETRHFFFVWLQYKTTFNLTFNNCIGY